MSLTHRVHVKPEGKQLDISGDRPLLYELADHGILLRSDCGGIGRCKKCQIFIEQDGKTMDLVEACVFRVTEDLNIHIPEASRLLSCIIDKAPLLLPESYRPYPSDITAYEKYGVAIDLGTTTIALYLCNIHSATVLASFAFKNPQSIYGDDVVNRISAITEGGGNTAMLQRPVVNLIDQALLRLCKKAKVDASALIDVVVVGNPTMIHIFLGENPETIGVSPYQPVFTESRQFSLSDLGFSSHQGTIRTLPLVSGFIGADTVAGVLAVDLVHQPIGTLLVDLGTNGELVLLGRNGLYATSCATGPAFEGASLSCGMQAISGAIDHVEIDDSNSAPRCRVIADTLSETAVRPTGLCGSGIVSTLAACLRTGIVQPSGHFRSLDSIPFLKIDQKGQTCYELISSKHSGNGSSISISQKDIRSIQLGKAALRAGIDHLLKVANLKMPEKILVAGAFGSYIEPSDMITLGMLPNIDADRIQIAGNAAGSGTVMALCNPDYFRMTSDLASSIKTIDLATNVEFQKTFIDRLKFPEN